MDFEGGLQMTDLIERKDVLAKLIALRKDSAEFSCENDIMHGKDIAYENAMDIIARMPSVNQWISVEDALPDAMQNVLVCTDIKTVTVAWINGDGWTFADTGNGHTENWSFENVKFWMPLPEPQANEVTK
jgi:hypothetical protein